MTYDIYREEVQRWLAERSSWTVTVDTVDDYCVIEFTE